MNNSPVLVIVSAHSEWRVTREVHSQIQVERGLYGEWFEMEITGLPVVFLHGGWGKISAAASAQYAVQRWQPQLVINLGTCGGFTGSIERGTIVMATETLVYDIIEQMGDAQAALDHYTARLDLTWLRQPFPAAVLLTRLISADRDIVPSEINGLKAQYRAVAADWESGAIAWVCKQNQVRCLILRGVSDLVAENGGEAYSSPEVFHNGTWQVMERLLRDLPAWLNAAGLVGHSDHHVSARD